MERIEFITGREIYERVIQEAIPNATRFLWLGTSDLKDLYIHKGKKMVPFLRLLSELIERGVEIRLRHAKEPGPRFREDFDKYPNLIGGMERILCSRVHFKSVIVDGTFAYSGSANLTGAGMGAKSQDRRNFESGFVTRDPGLVEQVMEQFDRVWMGHYCRDCKRKDFCTDYQELIFPGEG